MSPTDNRQDNARFERLITQALDTQRTTRIEDCTGRTMAKQIGSKRDGVSARNFPRSALNRRDREIVQTLTLKIPVASLRQLADAFFHSDPANAARRLNELTKRGLLANFRLNSRLLPSSVKPIFTWQPGDFDPNFSHLATLVSRRWLKQPTTIRSVYLAGPKSSHVSGAKSKHRPQHILQLSHDLKLAESYFYFRSSRPNDAQRWFGESAITIRPKAGQIPDAVICNAAGQPRMAIEVGGVYSAKRIEKLHRHCKSRSLTYEIW